jgi:transposase
MASMEQARLPEMPEPPTKGPKAAPGPRSGPPKLKPIDRDQGLLRTVIVEELVPPDHKVRAIWDLAGRLDLSPYLAQIRSQQGAAGCSAWDPRLMLSVWVYALSEQVNSAREIERMMAYEPGMMWLAGLGEVNHHTLSDFRADHPEALQELFAKVLGILSEEGFVKLELVAHDGTKIRTQGGGDQFRRRKTVEEHIALAKQMVEELDRQPEGEVPPSARRIAARARAARERLERMEQAAQELERIEAAQKSARQREQARVCLSEPEARIMQQGDHAMASCYNVQISTDAGHSIIVGMHLTPCSSDSGSLPRAMQEVESATGRKPSRTVVDAGFTNQASILAMKAAEIEMYGSLVSAEVRQTAALQAVGIDPAFGPTAFVVVAGEEGARDTLQCPAGKTLRYVRQSRTGDNHYQQYQAAAADCGGCAFQKQCCPRSAEKNQGRLVKIRVKENAEVAAFREKMATPEAQAIYKRRGAVAEFPNACIKEKFGLRKFRLRGLAKATCEALLAGLTYNILAWRRLSWLPKEAKAVAA